MNRKTNVKIAIGAFISTIILMISTMVSAYSVGMSLSSNSKLKAGETVAVTVSLGTIDAGNGIDTITAELEYDTNVFETLSTSSFIASNDWTPTFASATNMLTALKSTKVTKGETVLTINLKVKDGITATSTKITLKNIVVSGGRVSDGGTGDINVNNAVVTIKADSAAESGTENTTSNTTSNTISNTSKTNTTNTTKKNTSIKDNTVTSKTTLPKTGIEQYGVIAIVVVAIVGIFSYILYKKTSKEVK